MISVNKARELLGDKAKDMTDKEVEEIRDQLRSLAELCYEMWLKEKQKKKSVTNEQKTK